MHENKPNLQQRSSDQSGYDDEINSASSLSNPSFSQNQIADFYVSYLGTDLEIALEWAKINHEDVEYVPHGYDPKLWFCFRARTLGIPVSEEWEKEYGTSLPTARPRPIPKHVTSDWKPTKPVDLNFARRVNLLFPRLQTIRLKLSKKSSQSISSAIQKLV